MTDTEQLIEQYGDPAFAPPATETVHAGPLSVVVTADGDIRYIRHGEHELIRRVYAAVRARDWWTVPATVTVLEKTVGDDSFRIVSEALYVAPDRGIGFRAVITLTGDADGRVTFDFDGEATSDFERKRIGICVLNPADAKGAAVTVTHTDGAEESGFLPDTISPHQPFFDIAAIRHTVVDGLETEVTFSGDVFEMEDQRNWLDASFKTYSTPLALPSPVLAKAGERVRQTVMVRLCLAPFPPSPPKPLSPRSGERGLGGEGGNARHAPSPGIVWSEELAKPNAALLLPPNAHIWLRLDLAQPRWQYLLRRADKAAQKFGVSLYVCLTNAEKLRRAELPATQSAICWYAPAMEWENVARYVGTQLETTVGIGYSSNFTELNRERPRSWNDSPLFFAGNPQVHAADSLSIAETPPMIAEAIRTARTFAGGRPVHVGPLTFTGPYAASDPRETARFGQEWYEQILSYAIEAGADSVTLGAKALPVLQKWYAKGDSR